MATTKQGNAARKTINEERVLGDELSNSDFASMLSTIDWKAVIAKSAIGYVFAMTAFVAANNIAVMLALLTSIVWLQYVIFFAVLAALAVGVVMVTPLVSNAVYDAGAFVGTKIAAGYHGARAWFATAQMPSFSSTTVQ